MSKVISAGVTIWLLKTGQQIKYFLKFSKENKYYQK